MSIYSVKTADFFTETVSFALRFILSRLTYFLPFSLAEIMLFASVPAVLYLLTAFILKIIFAKRRNLKKTAVIFRGLFRIIAFCGFGIFIFTFTLGVCYGQTPVNEKNGKINFERRLLDVDDLVKTLNILIGEVNKIEGNIDIEVSGSTKMPYDLRELNHKLNLAYRNMLGEYDLFRRINSRVKPVIISETMTKMHITGVYAFFTGEANINTKFPDYITVYTMAHEMAHLMGIAREDEANFIAFLVCLYSEDDYIRYGGLARIIEYIGGALFREDRDRYFEIIKDMPGIIINEAAAFSEFFDKYRDTKISEVSSAANNAYLKAQGQEQGVKSYGFVVDLSVAYLLDIYKK
ncbi:MAG: DUF3810 domain-containing protein [Oscillospiraceae bacterium]|nr:DUF3810 domain-containing protein [Oscillospiraceae bacterium]